MEGLICFQQRVDVDLVYLSGVIDVLQLVEVGLLFSLAHLHGVLAHGCHCLEMRWEFEIDDLGRMIVLLHRFYILFILWLYIVLLWDIRIIWIVRIHRHPPFYKLIEFIKLYVREWMAATADTYYDRSPFFFVWLLNN